MTIRDAPQDAPDLPGAITDAAARREPRSVLEVGLGARPLVAELELGHDVRGSGIDASPTLVEAARRVAPDHEFTVADLTALELPGLGTADLVVCRELLTTVEDPDRFRLVVRRLLQLSNDVVLVAGRDTAPADGGPFHAPLSTSLLLAGAVDLVRVAGSRDGIVVYEGRVRR